MFSLLGVEKYLSVRIVACTRRHAESAAIVFARRDRKSGWMNYAKRMLAVLGAGCASLLLLTSCRLKNETRDVSARSDSIVSTWSLVQVDGEPPSRINVKEWRLTIRGNGTWSYAGVMQGPWSGMKLSGDGTWKVVSPDHLEYKAGDNRGILAFALNGKSLTFRPDPVLTKPGGAGEAVTEYERIGSRNSL